MPSPKGIRQAVKNELAREGLHTPPKQIVAALADHGIEVDEDAVRRVRIELLKNRDDIRQIGGVRQKSVRRPQKIPQRRPGRR